MPRGSSSSRLAKSAALAAAAAVCVAGLFWFMDRTGSQAPPEVEMPDSLSATPSSASASATVADIRSVPRNDSRAGESSDAITSTHGDDLMDQSDSMHGPSRAPDTLWTRSRGLTNALINRRDEFREFAMSVYEQGLSGEDEIGSNEDLLAPAIGKVERSLSVEGVLLCSKSICFYDLYADAETAIAALRMLSASLSESDHFERDIAYIREEPEMVRFYFITDGFPISRFYEQ